MLTMRFDGLFRPLPGQTGAGVMCYGWLILRDEVLIARGHGAVARGRDATSNVAEYLALIEGLQALQDLGIRDEAVLVSGDARGVIDQLRGEANVNSESIKPLYRQAHRLATRFVELTWLWMPRRFNRQADQLTRRAMRQARADASTYDAAVNAISLAPDRRQTRRLVPLVDLRVYNPC